MREEQVVCVPVIVHVVLERHRHASERAERVERAVGDCLIDALRGVLMAASEVTSRNACTLENRACAMRSRLACATSRAVNSPGCQTLADLRDAHIGDGHYSIAPFAQDGRDQEAAVLLLRRVVKRDLLA